ncbi:MAG: chlorite dismutase family protein [Terriglobia bacterium]
MTQSVDIQTNVLEHGANQQTSDRRLFMQLQVFGGCLESGRLVSALAERGVPSVLYQDMNDPRGVGVLTMHEDPVFFVRELRELVNAAPFQELSQKLEYTMVGRSYSSGYEPDLEDWLVHKPRRTVLNPSWPWAIWYPLRRTGAFSKLTPQEQGSILREHGTIGRAYGDADLAHDIRLACHGLDAHDNDFLIGLIGKQLHPLSHIVQTMRKTRQTSEYIQTLGPFFVGHVLWQSPTS